jgi:hypothetical protein
MIGSATLFQAGKLGTQRTIEKTDTKTELLDAVVRCWGKDPEESGDDKGSAATAWKREFRVHYT